MGEVAVDIELVEQQSSETVISHIEANPSTVVVTGSRGAFDVEAAPPIETGAVATEELLEARQKRLEKMVKLTFGLCVGFSGTLIIAAVTNKYISGISKGELILYKISAVFAFISFCAGVGLLATLHYERVEKSTRMGLIYAALISLLAAVLILAMNAVV